MRINPTSSNQYSNFRGKNLNKNTVKKAEEVVEKTIDDFLEPNQKIIARKYPSWLGLPEDYEGMTPTLTEKIAYFPEDIEKMKSMTPDEAWSYRARLFADNKYYIDKRPIVMSKELAEFMEKINKRIKESNNAD